MKNKGSFTKSLPLKSKHLPLGRPGYKLWGWLDTEVSTNVHNTEMMMLDIMMKFFAFVHFMLTLWKRLTYKTKNEEQRRWKKIHFRQAWSRARCKRGLRRPLHFYIKWCQPQRLLCQSTVCSKYKVLAVNKLGEIECNVAHIIPTVLYNLKLKTHFSPMKVWDGANWVTVHRGW